jgi:dihydroflavonol-4-reductase
VSRLALITGASGFVGGHLVERLLGQGWDVRALVRATSDTRHLDALGVACVAGDLSDAGSVERASSGCDTVFHLAAATFERDEASFVRANAEGTRLVADAVRRAGVQRLVYLSSYAACGPSTPGRPRADRDPPSPLTAYGRSKLAGEVAVREASSETLSSVIVRAPAVYGPRDRALLSYFRLVRNGGSHRDRRGDRQLHLVYAPDLAGALARAADAETGTYAVADPTVHTWSDLVDAIAVALDRRPLRPRLPVGLVRTAARLAESAGRLANRTVTFNREKAEEMLAAAWVCELSGSGALLPP